MNRSTFWRVVVAIFMVGLVAIQPAVAASTPENNLFAPAVPPALQVFQAHLSGANEVPAVESGAVGHAILVLDESSSKLYYRLRVWDTGTISGAHIHLGQPGENGAVVFTLFSGGTFDEENPISGSTAALTGAQVTDLLAGNYYINVHTTENPAGEIRGQIEGYTPPTHSNALMSGSQEVPAVETAATGFAHFTLSSNYETLNFALHVRDIENIQAAHLHLGAPGVNGGVELTLYSGGGSFDEDNPYSGSVAMDAENLVNLLTGYLYANIHTTAHAGGEIRGQVTTGFQAFEADLSGANEVPPVITEASGNAVFVLDSDMTTLHYRVSVDDALGITAAHIHEGEAGVNGGVIFPLFAGGSEIDEDSPMEGSLTVNDEQLADLVAGRNYVNVHTEPNPAGEMRGQIHAAEADDWNALLRGISETPAVDTDASGVAVFELNMGMDALFYEISVRGTGEITSAHLHPGLPGQSNPPAITIFGDGDLRAFDEANPIGGHVTLTATHLLNLLSGFFYLNVHTTENPGGEIRGQVTSGLHVFQADLSGENETTPVETIASGEALMVLDDDKQTLYYRVMVTDIENVTAAHIHEWPSGDVVFPLFSTPGTFDEDNPISGSLTLTLEQAAQLMAGKYYVNVHTTENPGGEIAGTLWTHTPVRQFKAEMNGEAEVPPVVTDASGTGHFTLGDELDMLHYHLVVADIEEITAAHLHTGWPGESGPPVITLFGAGDPRSFDEANPLSGDAELTAEQLLDLLTGYLYVNVHTAAYPDGEIRGQVLEDQGIIYMPLIYKNATNAGEE